MSKKKKRVSLLAGIEINRVKVNPSRVTYTSTLYDIPEHYEDLEFKCVDCGEYAIWWANDQKWWYETKSKPLEMIAVRCKSCRESIKDQKTDQKKHMKAMKAKKPPLMNSF